MSNNDINLGVALVKELCPICGKEMDGPIMMNKKLTKSHKQEVEDLHGKVIGFADHCCDKCAKYKDIGVYIIEIDENKSDFTKPNSLYRTGRFGCVRKECEFLKQENVKKNIIELEDKTQLLYVDTVIYNKMFGE